MNTLDTIVIQECLTTLRANGYSDIVEVMLEADSYTKKGRLNKSAIARKLGWKVKKLEDFFQQAQTLLGGEL